MNKNIDFEKLSMYERPEQSPGFLLWHISTTWRTSLEKTLKQLDLTHPQFVVLATLGWLAEQQKYVTQIDISRTAGLDPNMTSQILRGLETKKLIKRKQLVDERSKNPMLTDQGSEIIKKALPMVEQADAQFFSALQPDQLAILIGIFQKLIPNK